MCRVGFNYAVPRTRFEQKTDFRDARILLVTATNLHMSLTRVRDSISLGET